MKTPPIIAIIFITFFIAKPIRNPAIPADPAVNKAEGIISRLICLTKIYQLKAFSRSGSRR